MVCSVFVKMVHLSKLKKSCVLQKCEHPGIFFEILGCSVFMEMVHFSNLEKILDAQKM